MTWNSSIAGDDVVCALVPQVRGDSGRQGKRICGFATATAAQHGLAVRRPDQRIQVQLPRLNPGKNRQR